MSDGLHFADLFEAYAKGQPERPAIIQGGRLVSWAEFDREADSLAAHLLAAGLGRQSKVGCYMYNGPEYLMAHFAAFKAGLVPFNTNYRYGPVELLYLFENADAEAIVFHTAFTANIEEIRSKLPQVKTWIAVPEADHPVPPWAVAWADVLAADLASRPVQAPWGRRGEDLMFMYTGGTTGMPKAVMLRLDDCFHNFGAGGLPDGSLPPLTSLDEATQRVLTQEPLAPLLVAAPLMHGTGIFSTLRHMETGAGIALLTGRRFSAEEFWSTVERLRIASAVIVGMGFAVPMLEALEAEPDRWNLDCLRSLSSTGTMWQQSNKDGLLRHCRNAVINDMLASSEAPGYGASVSAPGATQTTARFALMPNTAVFTEDGRRVQPGSGERGLLAVTGRLPVGYYKDPQKTAETFRMFEGVRWSVPGDWAEVEADGAIKLLGRGSVSINTGGEKVFPEEVEEALKSHDKVRDAIVVGVPDARFGERICALVELNANQTATLEELAAHVRDQLAGYKAPRELVVVESIGRAANGKVDYKAAKAQALEALGIATV